jgi:hypothetical protein
MFRLVFFNFTDERWARSNETYLSKENIQQLGEFIKAVLAKESADWRYAGVVSDFKQN